MGIRNFDLEIIKQVLSSQNMKFTGLKMMQLGDQMQRERKIRAKEYFESFGVCVVSIDINGRGGSVPIDLSKKVEEKEYLAAFDLVTNFGTSEHVSDHITCLENMYDFCRVGGILYNLVPRNGYWNRNEHQLAHKYETCFFDNWAKGHNCQIIVNRVVTKEERRRGGVILSVLKKI